MDMSNEEVIGYIKALENEGEIITAQALSEAMEIPKLNAILALSDLIKINKVEKLSGYPISYKSV